jgi:large subunit ribosomal protein L9
MEVILLQRVDPLGQMGDVVRVKDGYARNFLLPQKKALRATKANREHFDQLKTQLVAKNLTEKSVAEAMSAKMTGLKVALLRQAGDTGQLYGSVSARDIAQAISDSGFTVDRQQVRMNAVIKNLGVHPVQVALHPEVTITVNINVARSEAEALAQAPDAGAAIFEEGAAPQPDADGPDADGPDGGEPSAEEPESAATE